MARVRELEGNGEWANTRRMDPVVPQGQLNRAIWRILFIASRAATL
jgi:hypothetical protein